MTERDAKEQGSTIPMIIGFFLLAMLMVAGSIALGQAFVQQRELQSICDGAAAAAAAGGGDLDRGNGVGSGDALRFGDAREEVDQYLARDETRRTVRARIVFSDDRTRITLTCRQTVPLTFGNLFGRPNARHTAMSSSRARVVD